VLVIHVLTHEYTLPQKTVRNEQRTAAFLSADAAATSG
jgi:hypothetical protein